MLAISIESHIQTQENDLFNPPNIQSRVHWRPPRLRPPRFCCCLRCRRSCSSSSVISLSRRRCISSGDRPVHVCMNILSIRRIQEYIFHEYIFFSVWKRFYLHAVLVAFEPIPMSTARPREHIAARVVAIEEVHVGGVGVATAAIDRIVPAKF